MRVALSSFTISSFILLVGTCPASERAVSKQRVVVQIYDYAHVSRGALSQAERTITTLLGQVGFELQVLRCWSGDKRRPPPDCLKSAAAPTLMVRILSGDGPGRTHPLGLALRPVLATVYYQRAVKFAAEQLASERVPAGQVLGFGAVHEIAHLLLVPHSPRGIMRAEWSPEEFNLMRARTLHFTSQQVETMRREVSRRAGRTSD